MDAISSTRRKVAGRKPRCSAFSFVMRGDWGSLVSIIVAKYETDLYVGLHRLCMLKFAYYSFGIGCGSGIPKAQ